MDKDGQMMGVQNRGWWIERKKERKKERRREIANAWHCMTTAMRHRGGGIELITKMADTTRLEDLKSK